MSTGLYRQATKGGSDPQVGTAHDEQTDFRADPKSLALSDADEEARATTWRVTLTGERTVQMPVVGYARGTTDLDALRRVDPLTISADLDDVELVAMIDYPVRPTPDEEG